MLPTNFSLFGKGISEEKIKMLKKLSDDGQQVMAKAHFSTHDSKKHISYVYP
jgi:hypothetical protein